MNFKPNGPKLLGSVVLGIIIEYTFEMFAFAVNNSEAAYTDIFPPPKLWFAYIILIIAIYIIWSMCEKSERKNIKNSRKIKKKRR